MKAVFVSDSAEAPSPPGATLQVALYLGTGVTAGAMRALVRLLDDLQVRDDLDLFHPQHGEAGALGVQLDIERLQQVDALNSG